MFYNFAPSGLCWFHSFHSQVSQALQPVLYNLAPLGLCWFHSFHSQVSQALQPVLYNFAPLGLVGVPFATGVFYMPCKGMIL